MAARFTAAQYAGAFMSLLPRGRVWQRSLSSVQGAVIKGLTAIYEQIDADAMQLLVDAFPATTTALINEWNQSVGIPDACFGAPTSIEQNRQFIVTKLAATGGQSVPYYTTIASTLGITIKIKEFSTNYPGVHPPDGIISTMDDWCHTWLVYVDTNSTAFSSYGGNVGLIQASQSYKALSCLLQRYKPAHTQLYLKVVDLTTLSTDPVFGFDLDTPYIKGFDSSVWSS